tara:strand:+ start:474 stop:1622 length:1149 start_codon:yes stop_codon:yes gene_type:complete
MTTRRILALTSTRADFGLLSKTLRAIDTSNKLELKLCVTGTHLSKKHGETFKFIEEDGFNIAHRIPIIKDNSEKESVSTFMATLLVSFSKYLEEIKPDLILLLGDRYEIFAAATCCTINRIPIAHIHGGELSEGAFDDAFRHSITKMSHIHFTSSEEHMHRVIQLGESKERVFNVGAPGVELIKETELLSKERIQENTGIKLSDRNFIITYHPETLDLTLNPKQQIENLLTVLEKYKDTRLIFTQSNADPGGAEINNEINKFVSKNKNSSFHSSLGQLNYLSILGHCDAMIGNSSSSLIEAPSFKLPALNIGLRQQSRMRSNNIINSKNHIQSIEKALDQVLSMKRDSIQNPFDRGNTSLSILEVLENIDLKDILNKKFYDL